MSSRWAAQKLPRSCPSASTWGVIWGVKESAQIKMLLNLQSNSVSCQACFLLPGSLVQRPAWVCSCSPHHLAIGSAFSKVLCKYLRCQQAADRAPPAVIHKNPNKRSYAKVAPEAAWGPALTATEALAEPDRHRELGKCRVSVSFLRLWGSHPLRTATDALSVVRRR